MDINPNTKGEEAVELFNLIKKNNLLPAAIDKLVPLSFIGQAAVKFYREQISLMDKLGVAEEQKKATLRDGQDAGEMLLDIEDLIGGLAEQEPVAMSVPNRGGGSGRGFKPSGKLPKHERLGMTEKKMQQSQTIHKNPEIVARVKAQARENEDIPTKTAVFAELKFEKEKERNEKEKKRRVEAEKNRVEIKAVISIDQALCISELENMLAAAPKKIPKRWDEDALKHAKTLVKLILKRLEVFNG